MMKYFDATARKYGLLMLGITALCLLAMELTGQNDQFGQSPYTAFYTFLAPALVWFLGLREYKKLNKGKMTVKEGIRNSFKIAVVYAVTSPFLFLAYYLLINPSIIEYVRTAYGLTGAPDAVVITVDMLAQVISAIIGGTIYGAIISFFLKTK